MATKKLTPKKGAKTTTKKPVLSKKDTMKKITSKKAAPAKKTTVKVAASKKAVAKPKSSVQKAGAKKSVTKPASKKAVSKPISTKKKVVKKVEAIKNKPVKKSAAKLVKASKPVKAQPVSKPTKVKPVAAMPVKKMVKPVPAAAKPLKPVIKNEAPRKTVKIKDDGPIKTIPKKSGKTEAIKEVKIPKTSVKTSVPYKPGYTPLEKRNEDKSNELLVRYSDAELSEFRELIMKKLESAKKELTYLQGLITRKDDMGGDETDNRYMTMEDGGMSMEREQLSQMASRQITYIDHLEKAIIRIENKTYGICRVTGKLIDKTRLRAVPHATLSLEAKLGLAKPVLNTP